MERISFNLASGAYILLGLIHLIGHLIVIYELQDTLVGMSMMAFDVRIFGMKNSVMGFLNGFSVSMAFLMIVYGVMNLLILKNPHRPLVYGFNSLVAAVFVIFSWFWFDILPMVLYGLIFLVFLTLFVNSLSGSSQRTL